MAEIIREVMSPVPVVMSATTPLTHAAQQMKEHHIGDVLVRDGDSLCGIVTDRDIVVRAVAEERDINDTSLDDICTHELVALSPDDSVDDAIRTLRDHAVRRLPVVQDGEPIGMVSIGDLAIERDPASVLAQISAAAPTD